LNDIHSILKEYWGYDQFRPLQEDIINSVLAGNDTLALMPTGGGKSLCYQVPTMATEGTCLVISPLIALMKDQVEALRKRKITAYAIYSGMSRKEVINVLKIVTESNCKFLYVSPERLETSLFREYLPGMGISLIAVDEAHCISQWGYDFRPPYLRIAKLREELPGVPVLALTASATPDVQVDICDRLTTSPPAPLLWRGEQNPNDKAHSQNLGSTPLSPGEGSGVRSGWNIFRQSFERPNLSYSVFNVDSKINKIVEIIKKVPGTGIVYCKSRKRTQEVSELLQLHGISSDYYHAGLMQEERSRKQEDWIQDRIRVIVCTNAFGMGIDKPGVRTVVHADSPDCLENYYQEAGRAGRDGKTSYAVLLYDQKDLPELEALAAQRFPSLEDIRNVYQSLANYLQLHTGDGEGQYFDLEMSIFLKNFKLDGHTALYSLKALEQDGWLSFNEQVFLPPTIGFHTTKEVLYAFEKEKPKHEPMIKSLLRAYEGIFDRAVPISEKVIANFLRRDVEEVKKELAILHQAGIIIYKPQKDNPQVLLLRPRVRTEEVRIDMVAFNKRKERFLERVQQMMRYVNEKTECRSRMLAVYFGDASVKDCGVCDNCLRKKQTPLTKEEFDHLHHRILNLIKYETLSPAMLLEKLNGVGKEKAWKIIEFLQAENKIEMDRAGLIKLK
jgi:ATP-dependent DNA helicase RecQ